MTSLDSDSAGEFREAILSNKRVHSFDSPLEMHQHILLQNATILVPSGKPNDEVVPLRGHSLLIEDNKIARIAQNVTPDNGTKVIDCTDKLVSPGFVDTHHHLWQTQLKGRYADQTLLEYLPNGERNLAKSSLTMNLPNMTQTICKVQILHPRIYSGVNSQAV